MEKKKRNKTKQNQKESSEEKKVPVKIGNEVDSAFSCE